MAKFKTRARAVDMLGRQQIAGIPTAISELFKNAHDAYADFADVDYFREDDIFVLRDDGIGMTEDEFLNRWLAIGTESKVDAGIGLAPPPKPQGKKLRPMLGEKGIGRLAIAAIGPQVLILTRANRDDEQHNVVAAFINWGIFESPGLNLDQIDIPVLPYTTGTLPSREDVTALVDLFRDNIRTLKQTIPPDLAQRISSELEAFKLDPQALERFLSQISNPTLTDGQGTQFFIQPTNDTLIADIDGDSSETNDTTAPAPPIVQRLIGFSNTMTDEQLPVIKTAFRDHKPLQPFTDLISPVSFFTTEEFKTADHHFRGEFDDFGQFNGLVTIYKKDPIEHTLPWTAGKGAPTKCGRFKINLAYVQGKPHESLLSPEEWARITGKLNKIGGLYIYRNGIRVLPYGSSDYDFLELERQRSKKASTAFFSYRRMFGFIEITTKANPDLNEKAGREGFRENAAYRDFRAILKNFFLQMANDFFRESGLYADVFVQGKGQLQRDNEVRRAREEHAKQARKQFAADLDHFFEEIETGTAIKGTRSLLDSVVQQIETAINQQEAVNTSNALIELESEVQDELQVLRERLTVAKPRAVGLTPALKREWAVYKEESQRIENEIFTQRNGRSGI